MDEIQPSVQYSVGSVIEDQNGIFKIERFQIDRKGHHLYYCKVLKWKIELPKQVIEQGQTDKMWIWVRPQSVENITVIEESHE
jgi:hypothetical protein